MSSATRRTSRRVVVCATITAVALGAAAPATASEEERVIEGRLADTTPFRFVVPDDWNGTVFVDMDFAAGSGTSPAQAHLVDGGAAYGGTTRSVTGWRIGDAIDNQLEAVDRFTELVGEPGRVIAMGTSMGGFVAAATAELHPDRVDGALAGCGGLSGTVSQWNQKLDTVFVLSRLLDPAGELPVVEIPDVATARAAWIDALAAAQQTPEGRARIALAAAIGQLPAWSQSVTDPDPKDAERYQQGWYGSLAGDPLPYIGQAMSSRKTIGTVFGGLTSWNTGIDYAEQLRLASPEARRVVEQLYAQAGLSLTEDLATVNAGERLEADPAAVERFARTLEFTGEISVPVLTLNNVGDQISTVAQQSEYESRVTRAGNAALLRQTYVGSAGHCSFTDAEIAAAADLLLFRLDTGTWAGRDTSVRLNAAAVRLGLGESRFITYQPDRFNR